MISTTCYWQSFYPPSLLTVHNGRNWNTLLTSSTRVGPAPLRRRENIFQIKRRKRAEWLELKVIIFCLEQDWMPGKILFPAHLVLLGGNSHLSQPAVVIIIWVRGQNLFTGVSTLPAISHLHFLTQNLGPKRKCCWKNWFLGQNWSIFCNKSCKFTAWRFRDVNIFCFLN